MSHGSKRSRRPHRSANATSFSFGGGAVSAEPRLVVATDFCLWTTFVAVCVCFGGRSATGQLVLVAGAAVTALCWLLHQLTSPRPRYTWTGTEWLWCLGIAICAVQIVPLSQEWLLAISPRIKEVLPLCFNPEAADIFPEGWKQLSLAPGETASGLATFLAYAMLFLVVAQRVRTIADVERMLCGVALAAISMATFALIQYATSNGKFFWTYVHPYKTTREGPVGCFTNRNHLAQFLALGTAPLIWWVLRRLQQQERDRAESNGLPESLHFTGLILLMAGLCGTILTALLTLSRGGLVAVAVASLVGACLLCRLGLASIKLVGGLAFVGAVLVGLFNATGYDALAQRLEQTTGRWEIWDANVKVARDFPILGTGVGTHIDAHHLYIDFPQYDGFEYTHAENGYLQVASETGVVGLTLAMFFIITSVWWCCTALWHSESQGGAAAAAILASLLANLVHALGDFFWYTPACMLLLSLQLACAFRLSRLTRESAGRSVWMWSPPRLLSLTAACGVVAVAAWMLDQKLPGARAESDRMDYLVLQVQGQQTLTDDEERKTVQRERWKSLFRAARLDPSDSRMQEAAAMGYLELFNARQELAENPLAHGQVRDAVQASEFTTREEMNDWLNRAVGKNAKLLYAAIKSLKRALRTSPLRAHAYIKLAELNFLEHVTREREALYLQQALLLRPHDPPTLFGIGRNVMLAGDVDGALVHWRAAFQHSPRLQKEIADLLAVQVDPQFFLTKFDPEWEALDTIARAFHKAARPDEARQIWLRYLDEGAEKLKADLSEADAEPMVILMRNACLTMDDSDTAVRILNRGRKRWPHNFTIRHALGWDLFRTGRFAEAAEHLEWCASRRPDDEPLQQATAHAIKERLKSSPERDSVASESEVQPAAFVR